jgi:hypothetical protein
MDRTKFSWPRWGFRKVPKSLEGIQRPRLVLTAAIAHGFTTCLFMAPECVFHGADAFLEILFGTQDGARPTCSEHQHTTHIQLVFYMVVSQG